MDHLIFWLLVVPFLRYIPDVAMFGLSLLAKPSGWYALGAFLVYKLIF